MIKMSEGTSLDSYRALSPQVREEMRFVRALERARSGVVHGRVIATGSGPDAQPGEARVDQVVVVQKAAKGAPTSGFVVEGRVHRTRSTVKWFRAGFEGNEAVALPAPRPEVDLVVAKIESLLEQHHVTYQAVIAGLMARQHQQDD